MGSQQVRPSFGARREHGFAGASGGAALSALLAALLLPLAQAEARACELEPGDVGVARAGVAGADLPGLRRLAFVENLGQWSTPASFVAALGRTVVRVNQGGFVVDARPEGEPVQLRFSFEGARADVELAGEATLPGLRNYLKGNDPDRWVRGARAFERVLYSGLYENVDLRVREENGMPAYDLLLEPGADLTRVVVRCEGASGLELDEEGGLRMHSAHGVLRQSPPVTWCVLPSGEREPLECAFVVLGESRYGFRLAEHDAGLPVVIDPGLEWATYLGGSGTEEVMGMALAPGGEIVVTGWTNSPDFPPGLSPTGSFDGFVAVLDPTGSTLLHSTLLGGNNPEIAYDVQVNASGEVFVVGFTASTNFPLGGSPYLATYQGGGDGFVVELSPDLSNVVYGSYLGGSGFDDALRVLVREPRVLTIGGGTGSTDLLTITPGTAVQPGYGGGATDYFLCRLDLDQPPASQLSYGTYLGGSAREPVTSGSIDLKSLDMHEDAAGRVTVSGWTESPDNWTTVNGYDTSFNGLRDGWLATIDPSQSGLSGLEYATFLGGSGSDGPNAIAVDPSGVITVGGFTYSADFPTTAGALETAFHGPSGRNDGFLLRLDPNAAQQLLYGTFLAGDGYESVLDLALDAAGRIVAVGFSGENALATNGFPTTSGAFQTAFGGVRDGFVVQLGPWNKGACDLLYSTFFGGPGDEGLIALAITSQATTLKVAASGYTNGSLPTTAGAYQPSLAGGKDVLVLELEIGASACVTSFCTAGTSASGCTATLSAAGLASATAPSGFVVTASGVEGAKDGLFFFGTGGRQANPWGNGTSYQCVVPPVKRAGLQTGAGTSGACNGAFSQDLNGLWCPTCSNPAKNPGAGALVQAQLWYRDPFNTSNQTTGFSDAIEFLVSP